MFERVFLVTIASIVFGGAVKAADIGEPMSFDWTGASIGLQGGYAWDSGDDTEATCDTGGGGDLFAVPSDFCGGGLVGELLTAGSSDVTLNSGKGSIGLGGFVGGLNAGYSWQIESVVLGVEGDIEFSGLEGDTDLVDAAGAKIGEVEKEIDWLGSLRLRAGYAFDRVLPYVTGGLAVGGAELSLRDMDQKVAENNDTKWGWTVGAGLDYALTDNLTARIECRYTDLGDISAGDPATSGEVESDLSFHAVRAGLGWRF
ncbi:MAG: outer membrane protein [Pseudomonadota bacterium]